jgi:hypothetical protein
LSPAEYHAEVLIRSADYVRSQRPEWTIGQASWGLFLDEPSELEHLKRISEHVDYMVEVIERTARTGVRKKVIQELACPFGSVGGMFVEPPQHWERLRWFVPCGLGSARSLKDLWNDGGTACEYFFRPFANPAEEVAWRTGARILTSPETEPKEALVEAVSAVYGVKGKTAKELAEWYDRGEQAYFSRSNVKVGDASLSLEPLIWTENPSAPGPPQYVKDHLTIIGKMDYVRDLKQLKQELAAMDIPDQEAMQKTLTCIDGTINECEQLLK